jgi:hypothetical protein
MWGNPPRRLPQASAWRPRRTSHEAALRGGQAPVRFRGGVTPGRAPEAPGQGDRPPCCDCQRGPIRQLDAPDLALLGRRPPIARRAVVSRGIRGLQGRSRGRTDAVPPRDAINPETASPDSDGDGSNEGSDGVAPLRQSGASLDEGHTGAGTECKPRDVAHASRACVGALALAGWCGARISFTR